MICSLCKRFSDEWYEFIGRTTEKRYIVCHPCFRKLKDIFNLSSNTAFRNFVPNRKLRSSAGEDSNGTRK